MLFFSKCRAKRKVTRINRSLARNYAQLDKCLCTLSQTTDDFKNWQLILFDIGPCAIEISEKLSLGEYYAWKSSLEWINFARDIMRAYTPKTSQLIRTFPTPEAITEIINAMHYLQENHARYISYYNRSFSSLLSA